jgi:hypothetical protein
MSIAQVHVFGLNLSLKSPINLCPEVSRYECTDILRIKFCDETCHWLLGNEQLYAKMILTD